jgi:hypothetical protein
MSDVLALLAHRANDLARLQVLTDGGPPVVTVVGKYNHGKSRLLNELIEREVFEVADRRETVRLSDTLHDGVRWLDAPGLDADVGNGDDRLAWQAAWIMSDIRLFVHSAKEGELDASESGQLTQFRQDDESTGRRTLFVLSQADQLADDAELDSVLAAIGRQAPGMPLQTISSTRYRKGRDERKNLLLERSGIPALRVQLNQACAAVPEARVHELALLFASIRAELRQRHEEMESVLGALRNTQQQQRQNFDQGLRAVIEKVSGDIDTMLNALGTDHAIIPDGPADAYRITAGKQERAHIQIAYSRACIELDGYLTSQGVAGLPLEQQTVANSLNSVMIAVMGVSVKFRKDLRRMFCEPQGRERLQREFSHYYELSADRRALAARVAETQSGLAAFARALASLNSMEQAGGHARG